MFRIALFFLLLICTSCTSLLREDKEAAELHLRVGTSFLAEGDYPRALNELLIAESLDKSNPMIQNNLALAYFVRQKYELAEMHLRNALELKPDYSDARNNLGRVLIERGKAIEAKKELQSVISDLTYPFPEKPLTNLGIAEFKLGEFEASRKTLLKAIEIQRDNCLAQSYYGRTFFEKREFFKAAEALDRAAGFCIRTQNDEPVYYSGVAYLQLGDFDKAENRLETVLKAYPQGRYHSQARQALETIKR